MTMMLAPSGRGGELRERADIPTVTESGEGGREGGMEEGREGGRERGGLL